MLAWATVAPNHAGRPRDQDSFTLRKRHLLTFSCLGRCVMVPILVMVVLMILVLQVIEVTGTLQDKTLHLSKHFKGLFGAVCLSVRVRYYHFLGREWKEGRTALIRPHLHRFHEVFTFKDKSRDCLKIFFSTTLCQ